MPHLFLFLLRLFLFLRVLESHSSRFDYLEGRVRLNNHVASMLPKISPLGAPQPFLPLAPSPLAPFTNTSEPKLSGLCTLNFTTVESLISVTAIDCWEVFAPFLANVICCPQLEATLTILIGQSSKYSDVLALNGTVAKHCLADVEQILMGQGATSNLKQICSINSSKLTEASCPVKNLNDFYDMVDTTKLLTACKKIDPVKECCYQVCQNAILEAATTIASKGSDVLAIDAPQVQPEHSIRVNDCRNIVLRWVASKLEPSQAKKVLRGLSNCNVNKVCPLVFPDTKQVAKGCADGMSNKTACCNAMESYVSHLQKQSFITNLQALDCAETLATKLKRSNITADVYGLCHISLKDFSLQVGNQEAGCLLPSLPSDATFDRISGISFLCDLNDNIPAPWPSTSQLASSSCNKSVNIPALPAAATNQSCKRTFSTCTVY
uniref:GPI-anchored protein At1g61900 family n=1 Tax=Cajanus cajan TaxID=3821 RepID=A0A151U0V9_CAJCA|nr:putative GPI-anchored protein At1g61900 family [Cajanus cajan]